MMSRWIAAPVLSMIALAALPSSTRAAADAGAQADAGPPVPACVLVTTQARYRALGYDHVVILANGCARTVDCVVKTDVNPDPTRTSVKPKEIAEVVTWIGSPASEFKADVKCVER